MYGKKVHNKNYLYLYRHSIFYLLFCTFFLTFSSLEAFDVQLFSINAKYRIFFGKLKHITPKLYFLPCGNDVLAISVGSTPYLGKTPHLHKKMLRLARINAQNQMEKFLSSQMSARQEVSLQNGKYKYSSEIIQEFDRNISMWEIIGTGVSADRKTFGCIIGRLFPKDKLPPLLFD